MNSTPDVRSKFATAKQLIEQKHYDEARVILREIDHPAAQEWLRKLDGRVSKKPKRRSKRLYIGLALGGLLLIVLVAVGIIVSRQQAAASERVHLEAILFSGCSGSYDYCLSWAQGVLSGNEEIVRTCDAQNVGQAVYTCLRQRGIRFPFD